MSVKKWAYDPERCDGTPCPGDCDKCTRWQHDEWLDDVTYCAETDHDGKEQAERPCVKCGTRESE